MRTDSNDSDNEEIYLTIFFFYLSIGYKTKGVRSGMNG